ncbi:MAG TPA: class D sortase [Methylomirabilota bacterium]|nr:class D sortase [Methylomirabilota bacterium]
MAKKAQHRKKKKKNSDPPNSRVNIKFRKHILPPLAGLLVAFLVFGFFNSGLISGKIAYYFYQKHASVSQLDTSSASAAIDKNAPPQIKINTINVNAPIVFDQKVVDQTAFHNALERGVVHYPNTAMPGQRGNVVIFGHSSGQWWAPGDYKFVFTLLDKVKYGDKIFLDYQGTRYIYKVNNLFVVDPTDLSVLNQGGNYSLTLITCTPVGTSARRLIVQAQQISPKPGSSLTYTKAATLPAAASGNLPSSDSSFWHNLRELLGL